MKNLRYLLLAAALSAAGLVASCGGGGGGTAVDPLTPQGVTDLSASSFGYADGGGGSGDSGAGGGAGDGSPLRKAVIIVTDATGKSATGLTDDNGNYFVRFSNFTSPIVAKVVDAGGNVLTSVTEEQAVAGKAVRVMINPLTDKIVSDTVVSGVVPGTDKNFDGSKVDLSKLAQAKSDLRASINAALAAVGITSAVFDPIKSTYSYDGSGVDAIIESISHTRDPNTGATQLRTKLVSVDAGTTLITAAAPLAPALVAAPNNQGLVFAKLQAWTTELNRCAALTLADRNADANCHAKLDPSIASDYLHSSRDFDEHLRTLFSNSDRSIIQGSTFRNPVLLFTSKYPGSTNSYDDLAVVEMTIRQPGTGPLAGNGTTTIEYPQILVFRRDDTLNGALLGNWILQGNKRNFDFSVEARYDKFVQNNPARAGNSTANGPATFTFTLSQTATGNVTATLPAVTFTAVVGTNTATKFVQNLDNPSIYATGLRLFFNPQKFDIPSRTYVSAGIAAVKLTGPGLPAAGVVMGSNFNNVCGGSGFMTIANAIGSMPTSTATFFANNNGNTYSLSSVLGDGTTPAWYTTAPGAFATRVKPNVTDFSSLSAYGLYRADILLTTGATVTEYNRILAPVESPTNLAAAQWNDVSPNLANVSSPAISSAVNNYNIQWINNANAAFVESVFVNAAAYPTVSAYQAWSQTTGVSSAASVTSRPTSQASGYPTDPNCTATGVTTYPAMNNPTERLSLGVRAWQGRARRYNSVGWTN